MAVEVGELLARMKLDTSGMQTGVDKLSTLTSDITKQFDAMRSELEGSTGAIAASVNQTTGVMAGLAQHTTLIAGAGAAISGVTSAVGAGLIMMSKDAGHYAEQLTMVRQRTGLDLETIQAMFVGLNRTGLDFGNVEMGFRKLSTSFDKAREKMKEGQESFELFGQTFTGAESPTQIFMKFADAINAITDPMDKVAAASEVFGSRVGQKMIPFLEGGSQGFAAMAEEAKKMGLVLDPDTITKLGALDDKFDDIGSAMQGFRVQVGAQAQADVNKWAGVVVTAIEFASRTIAGLPDSVRTGFEVLFITGSVMGPALLGLAAFVKAWATLQPLFLAIGAALATPAALFLGLAAAVYIAYTNMEQIGEAVAHVATWFNDLVGKGLQSMIDGFKNMGKAVAQATITMKNTVIRVLSELVDEIKEWVGSKLDAAMNSPAAKAVMGVINKFVEMKDKLVTHSVVPEMVDEIGNVMGQLPNQMVPPVDRAVANIQAHMETLEVGMSSAARRTAVGVGSILQGGTMTWTATMSSFATAATSTWGSLSQTVGTNLAKMTDEEVKWGEVTKQIGMQVLSTAITTAIGVATQWAISGAGMVASQIMSDSARVASATTADSIILASATTSAAGSTSVWGGAADLITGSFGSVAGGFSSIAGSLVEGVIAIGSFIMTVLGAIGSALSATVFGIPFAGAIFAGIALIAAALAMSGNLPFLAEGGIVNGPTLAMIGERGPEAVVPLDKADGFGGGRGSATIIFQVDKKEMARMFFDELPDYAYLKTKMR